MIENPIDGEYYWSIAVSNEATNYETGREAFRWPWKGLLAKHPSIIGFYYVLRASKDDNDPNSFAVVDEDQLYLTEDEALLAYAQAAEKKSEDMIDESHELASSAMRARQLAQKERAERARQLLAKKVK